MRKTSHCDAISRPSVESSSRKTDGDFGRKDMNPTWKQFFSFHGSTLVAQRKGKALKSCSAPVLFFFLLLTGEFALTFGEGDNDGEFNFDCTNDFEQMFCQYKQGNCTNHKVTFVLINSIVNSKSNCTFKQCDNNQCCCSVKMLLIYQEIHNATVWRGNERVASKNISVKDSFKPKTPAIVNVTVNHGNVAVMWKTNLEGVRDELTAVVTYYKKEDPEKQVSISLKPLIVNKHQYFEISEADLSPGATYVISVRSVGEWSNRSSDSSAEWEFKTPTSPYSKRVAIIVILSALAIFLSAGAYIIFSKFKSKWWDKYSDLKLPTVLSSKKKILVPSDPISMPVSVEPLSLDDGKQLSKLQFTGSEESDESSQGSSGISVCSSQPSYAETVQRDFKTLRHEALEEIFGNIGTVDLLDDSITTRKRDVSRVSDRPYGVDGVRDNSGSSGVINPTYFPGGCGSPDQFMPDQPRVLECEASYHTPKSDTITNTGLSCLFPAQLNITSPISIDMSYQCTPGSQKMLVIEDYSPLSPSSGSCTTPPYDPESRDNAESESPEVPKGTATLASYEETPRSFLQVKNDYQPFQRQAEESNSLLSPERSREQEEHLERNSEMSTSSNPQTAASGFFIPDMINENQPKLQMPFLSSPPQSGNMPVPIFTESGYKQV
ncbi:hypothetical protein OJAV_G00024660 [Oryzias javanicus]|uniref:Fibronectin type-III domain-containing protein n=1 Tax=Oryzias javanicus TaxID=123683 RepID=A0A3S2N6N5_ORYJA|nr:hypothetical protein OJAV_G00024660 [Oryzias javanicus]